LPSLTQGFLFLLYIICVVAEPSAGDIGCPLLSQLTKHGEAACQGSLYL
jgi:hypothetical protein